MATASLILAIILVLGLGAGGAIWFFLRQRQPAKQTVRRSLPFRWNYIILPVAILLLSIALAASFYPRLPPEVAYNFKLTGSPDSWLSREMTVVWTLAPQLLLTALAAVITWGLTKVSGASKPTEGARVKPGRTLALMGNMVALPQIILCFALVDIFSYNSYQMHIIPLWVFTLIIMGLGSIVIGVFLLSSVRRT